MDQSTVSLSHPVDRSLFKDTSKKYLVFKKESYGPEEFAYTSLERVNDLSVVRINETVD